MISKLYKISQKELECADMLSKIKGEIEEKNFKIEKSGIPKLYIEILFEYAKLAEKNIEALKRAIFLIWYSRLEPFFITGMNFESEINELNKIIEILDRNIQKNQIDSEFYLMLNHYSKWDFIFLNFSKYKYLQKFIIENSKLELSKAILPDMKNRGEMGEYWNSIKKTCS